MDGSEPDFVSTHFGGSPPPYALASRGVYLEAVADSIRFDAAPGRAALSATDEELLQVVGALRVIDGIDALINSVLNADESGFERCVEQLQTSIDDSSMLSSLAGRRLRRLVGSSWFESLQRTTAPRWALCDRLRTISDDMARAADEGADGSVDLPRRPGAPPAYARLPFDALLNREEAKRAQFPSLRDDRPRRREPTLSAREFDVVRLVAEGLTNKEIAIRLDLSPNTIKRHMARVLRRLGVAKRSAVATWYATHARADAQAWQEAR